jgi:hypothetical protein
MELGQAQDSVLLDVVFVDFQVQGLVVEQAKHETVTEEAVAGEHPSHFDRAERTKYIDHVSSEFIHRRHESADAVVCYFSSAA